MPKFLEDKLKAEAAAKGFKGKRAARYVYGGLNNMGAMHGSKETAKGADMQAKHEAKMHATMKTYRGASHNFNQDRPKRKVVSRYS